MGERDWHHPPPAGQQEPQKEMALRAPPANLPLSWGRGCSSTGLPWLRNCDEPWERFCLSALRTDFRVKPSTFSEAEMAALAAPAAAAGGDDADISAAQALASSGGCLHGTDSGRRRRRGRGAERSRPSAPCPQPHRLPAPGRRRASSPRRPPTPHERISGPEVPGPPPRGGLPGPTEARAGAQGGREVVDSGRGGRVEGSLKFRPPRRRSRGADAERASRPFSPGRRPAGQQHLSGRCQSNPPSLESPPEALPSRVPSEPLPRCPLFPVSAVPSSPVAVTRRPGSGRAH